MTHHETVFTVKEKTNPDIKPQRVKITYTPSEAMKKSGACYIKIRMELNENTKLTGKFDVGKISSTEFIIDDKN